MSAGVVLTMEGGEGTGKTTQMALLSKRLEAQGYGPVILTREPGGTVLGNEIRRLLVSATEDSPTPSAELLLYAADRAHHVETHIRPALQMGRVVLCDVKAGVDRAVHEKLLALKPADGVTPVEVEMGFHSVDFDLAVLIVGSSERGFYRYIEEHVRSVEGIHDTFCEVWEIEHAFCKAEEFVQGWTAMAD